MPNNKPFNKLRKIINLNGSRWASNFSIGSSDFERTFLQSEQRCNIPI